MKANNKFLMRLRLIMVIIRKELLATMKDPKSRFVLIMPVIIQGIVFGYAATYNLDSVPYALVDESHSHYATEFIAHLDGSGIFERVATMQGTADIASPIDTGQAMIVIHIGQDFAERISRGETASVQVITDGRNPVTADTAAGYVSSIAATCSQELTGQKGLVTLVSRIWYNPNELTRWMFMPQLIGVLALTQVMMLAGLSVARERENGTFDQLLVTPLQPQEILIGKAVPPILVGVFQCTLMFLLALFWFRVPFAGSVGLLYLVIVVFLISCVGIGLTISAISATMQQVMVYNFTCMLPMILLSGLATPVANMPVWMQYFTYVNPLRFALEALRRVYLEGASFGLIAGNFVPLLIITCITMPVAAWMFRHKLA